MNSRCVASKRNVFLFLTLLGCFGLFWLLEPSTYFSWSVHRRFKACFSDRTRLNSDQLERSKWVESTIGVGLLLKDEQREMIVDNTRQLLEQGSLVSKGGSKTGPIYRDCELRVVREESTHSEYVTISPDSNPIGVLVAFHGFRHSAKDFCYSSAKCPQCSSLPEAIRVVEMALQLKMRFIAITPSNGELWEVPTDFPREVAAFEMSNDIRGVLKVLEVEGIFRDALPIVVFGASEGAVFASVLAQSILGDRMIGLVSNLYAGELFKSKFWLARTTPVVFSLMAADEGAVLDAHAYFEKGSINMSAGEVFMPQNSSIGVIALRRKALTARLLVQRMPPHPLHGPFTIDMGTRVVKALQDDGLIAADGAFNSDPRSRSSWQESVRNSLLDTSWSWDSVEYDQSSIVELMNVIYCHHEFYSDYLKESLLFIFNAFLASCDRKSS